MNTDRFLVVGASGFIGSHIHEHAQTSAADSIGTKSSSPTDQLSAFDLRTDSITDCVAREFWDSGDRRFAVICSCISQIDRCFLEREQSRQVNVEGTIRLIDDLRRHGVRIAFLSTSHVFDGNVGGYSESAAIDPQSEYGRQKVVVEEHLMRAAPESLIVRLDKIVGDRPAESHLFSEWRDLAKAGRNIVCIADQVLSPTLVDDVARAVIAGCQQGISGIWHLANPEQFLRADLAQLFVARSGSGVAVEEKPVGDFAFADVRLLRTFLDGSRFIAATGVEFTSMSVAIDRFLSS
ncbi:MAG: sugar nucleotide-binding protein [Pirellulaceae bacterium]|nr:sugar nucleotide-binding protein [Pirellulaceae bacterium]